MDKRYANAEPSLTNDIGYACEKGVGHAGHGVAQGGIVLGWYGMSGLATATGTAAVNACRAPKKVLTASQRKSIRSYQKRIAEHQAKLDAYRKNPAAFDNKGLLKNAPNDAVRQRIIDGRIKHLQQEIEKFLENIRKIER